MTSESDISELVDTQYPASAAGQGEDPREAMVNSDQRAEAEQAWPWNGWDGPCWCFKYVPCAAENEKSNEEKQKEEELVQQIHKLVETWDCLVDDVEFERLREREEDKEMAEFLQTPVKEKKMTSRGQQTSAPYMTKTGLTLLKECCGFTCSIM
ncbi:PREDICTED: uncharacterized protein C16orf45-like [Calidris pugnax]|uniref:uncharacterized protein C16orf45-like n=1 Tax=Calidris pugnax TaxID=198806 RepID=UPI00071D7357|nr:PREDICTED: uncharacterized protein C16orf45-like [Calidris pugnax]